MTLGEHSFLPNGGVPGLRFSTPLQLQASQSLRVLNPSLPLHWWLLVSRRLSRRSSRGRGVAGDSRSPDKMSPRAPWHNFAYNWMYLSPLAKLWPHWICQGTLAPTAPVGRAENTGLYLHSLPKMMVVHALQDEDPQLSSLYVASQLKSGCHALSA